MAEEDKKLRALIGELERIKGRHTELVSVYVPQGFNLNKVVEQLRNEQGTASNIKSKAVRKNVLSALERILQHLKLYKQTPPNGLVLFSGNVSDREGVDDIELWAVEPQKPVKNRLYWCGQNFILDPLKDMVRETEVYGIILIEASESDVGILNGKKVSMIKHMDSLVPNKFAKGGWCVHESTLIPMADGKIMPVKDIGNMPFMSFDFKGGNSVKANHNHYFKRNSDEAIRIITHHPRIEISVTPEHEMFIAGEGGINTKRAGELVPGDRLLAARRVSQKGRRITVPKSLSWANGPKEVGRELASLAGYIMGDGHTEQGRITLHDSDPEIARHYKKIAEKALGANCTLHERKGKNYWQARIYGHNAVKLISGLFPGATASFEKNIDESVMRMDDEALSGFLQGLFDAEGYVGSGHVGLTMGRECVIRALQVMLLRFGIVSSLRPVNGKSFAKRKKYAVTIGDYGSLKNFSKHIGFSGRAKSSKLRAVMGRRTHMSRVDQIPADGRYIRNLLNNIKMNVTDFPKVSTNHFRGEKQISREFFRKDIINTVELRLKELKKQPNDLAELKRLVRMKYSDIGNRLGTNKSTVFSNMKYGYNTEATRAAMEQERRRLLKSTAEAFGKLRNIASSEILSVKVHSAKRFKPSGHFYDMEVGKHANFIANGLVVHNSANRFARVREGLLEDFMKKTAEVASAQFKEMKDLKGVIVGGGGPTKEMFASRDYLDYRIKEKVLGIVNTSYMGMPGLQEAVDKAEDLMSQAAVVKEKKLLDRFFGELAKDSGLAVYGLHEVADALKAGKVDVLLVSESFDWAEIGSQCSKCNYKEEKLMRKGESLSLKCSKCGANANVTSEKSLLDGFVKLAESENASVEFISVDTPKGEQLKEIGGIAAILRYKN